nr:galactose oxidase [Nitrosomonas sp.]
MFKFKYSLLEPRIGRLKSLILAISIYGIITPALAASDAHLKGKFGPLHDWPIIPIAMMLMPDGRIFAYGTNTDGEQGAKLHYAIWNPLAGTGASAFETLTNTTNTDIFCAAQALIPGSGHALLVGGDAMVSGQRNYGNNNVNIFNPNADALVRQSQNMAFKRWYATAVTLANGEHAILGGRNSKYWIGTSTYSSIPEVRAKNGNWRSLSSASSEVAYGEIGGDSWFYPRAWVNPQGKLFILGHSGAMYKLDTSGTGTLTRYAKKTASGGYTLPSVMFAPGRILSIRRDRVAVVVNINGAGEPVVSSAGFLTEDRRHGNTTVLADGQVWVNGGSTTGNTPTGMILTSELWNPGTGKWTTTASAAKARLYHSASILLPDGSVLTGGGGAPGPIQLNGEIFYP